VIEAGSNHFTVPLHPRLTVIAGVGHLERESLTGELIGALGSSRSGVHAELVQDDGRHLAVFRPEGGRHRVVDIDAATDVSHEFTTTDGRIDLLDRNGIDRRRARRAMRFSSADLSSGSHGATLIRQLADADQTALWTAAEELQAADDRFQRVAEEVGSAPEDAEVVDRIERRHNHFEAAQERQERSRRSTFVISALNVTLAVPAGLLVPWSAFAFVGLATISVLVSVLFRIRVSRAAKAEEEALADAGAQSYLGFQIQRVNGLLSSDQHRRALMSAAEDHRRATAAWHDLAGEAPVDWAVDHREEIVATARVRRDVTALGTLSSTAPSVDTDRTADLAHVLVARMAELRRFGASGESFPLILDDPFADLERAAKPALLELLGRSDGPQLIFLTDDEDVASWARLEALTGALTIVEPQPEHSDVDTLAV
jgi:hypothetical protein